MRLFGYIGLGCIAAFISLAGPILAQPSEGGQETNPGTLLRNGIEAFVAGDYKRASNTFAAITEEEPSYYDPAVGSAAYWLGHALSTSGYPDEAHRAYSAGLRQFNQAEITDPRLVDAYIQSVFDTERTLEYSRAGDAYLSLIRVSPRFTAPEEKCIVVKHISQILPLLTPEETARVTKQRIHRKCERWQVTEEAGAFLTGWWQVRDPILATMRNERVEIHLQRVSHAIRYFPNNRHVSQLDDRGEVFLRFGSPSRVKSLRQNDNPLVRRADVARDIEDWANLSPSATEDASTSFGPGEPVVVVQAGLPRGELWLYDHIDHAGYYFFVKEGRRYRLGQISDMVPMQLRNFHGWRGHKNAGLLANMLFGDRVAPGIYVQLAPVHPDFAAQLTAFELANELAHVGAIDWRSLWIDLRQSEDLATSHRDRTMPQEYIGFFRHSSSIPVHVRIARFLDDDAKTRTDIYWTINPRIPSHCETAKVEGDESYEYSSEAAPTYLTIAQSDSLYQTHTLERLPIDSNRLVDGESESDLVHTATVRGAGRYDHIALQWIQMPPDQGNTADLSHPASAAYHKTIRLDSLYSLSAADDRLEMSDIVPVFADEVFTTNDNAPVRPYPYHILEERDAVGLHFEIYRLNFGPHDMTRYTVEYEVVRRKRGLLLGLFRDRTSRTTAHSTSFEGQSRNVQETTLLSLEDWGPGELEIIVRVQDEISGQQVERSISFCVNA